MTETLKYTWLISFLLIFPAHAQSQTVGVLNHKEGALDAYTFFTPFLHNTSYLIDNCGRLINKWEGDFDPGISNKLTSDGTVIRTKKIPSAFDQTSAGGGVEIVNWENEILWSYDFSDSLIQHHHVEDLPNGNLLMMAWEKISPDLQLDMGRESSKLIYPNMWSEIILEVAPIGTNQIDIVWKWHLKDHLVQDHDSSKLNYGSVADEFGKIDINYVNTGKRDLWHVNAIDYNESLDQILVTSRENNEIWILDHSTSIEEAASDRGGIYDRGGEIIYRWGNPLSSKRGNSNDWKLFGCHGAHWIKSGLPNEGGIIFFNNGDKRPGPDYSSVEILFPEFNPDGKYFLNEEGIYGPATTTLLYKDESSFFSRYLSNAIQLPNGNIFINEGSPGNLYEVDSDAEIVWEYKSPVDWNGPVPQGFFPNAPGIFRAYRYSIDHPMFLDKDTSPGELLELNSDSSNCLSSSIEDSGITELVNWYHNPDENVLIIENFGNSYLLNIHSTSGKLVVSKSLTLGGRMEINLDLDSGIYFLSLLNKNKILISSGKIFSK